MTCSDDITLLRELRTSWELVEFLPYKMDARRSTNPLIVIKLFLFKVSWKNWVLWNKKWQNFWHLLHNVFCLNKDIKYASVCFILRMANQWITNDTKLICNPVRAQRRRFPLQITFGVQINVLSMEIKIFFSERVGL